MGSWLEAAYLHSSFNSWFWCSKKLIIENYFKPQIIGVISLLSWLVLL